MNLGDAGERQLQEEGSATAKQTAKPWGRSPTHSIRKATLVGKEGERREVGYEVVQSLGLKRVKVMCDYNRKPWTICTGVEMDVF